MRCTKVFFKDSYAYSDETVKIIIGIFDNKGDNCELGRPCCYQTWAIAIKVGKNLQLIAEGEEFVEEIIFNDSPRMDRIREMIRCKIDPEEVIQNIQTMREEMQPTGA